MCRTDTYHRTTPLRPSAHLGPARTVDVTDTSSLRRERKYMTPSTKSPSPACTRCGHPHNDNFDFCRFPAEPAHTSTTEPYRSCGCPDYQPPATPPKNNRVSRGTKATDLASSETERHSLCASCAHPRGQHDSPLGVCLECLDLLEPMQTPCPRFQETADIPQPAVQPAPQPVPCGVCGHADFFHKPACAHQLSFLHPLCTCHAYV